MSNSIKDQLIALGLTSEKPARKRTAKPGSSRRHRKSAKVPGGEIPLDQAWRMREKQEKTQAAQARQRKLADERRRREINDQIRTIVDAHRLNRDEAELARNFMFKGRIRKIMVSAEQLEGLNDGDLGVVYLSGGYHLLAKEWVEKVRALSAEHVPDINSGNEDDGDHPVPDDLQW